MKRYLKIILPMLLCIISVGTLKAQNKVAEKLSLLPKEYRTLVEPDMLQMIQFYTPGDTIGLPNLLEGTVYLKQMTDNYISVQMTESSTLQMKCLTGSKGEEIYVTVHTVYGPAGDSEVRFFNAQMQPLDTKKYIKLPQLKNFFDIPKGSLTKMGEIEKMLPFVTIEATLSPDNDDLVFNLTCQDYVSRDDYNILKLFLQPARYTWQKGKYVLVNN